MAVESTHIAQFAVAGIYLGLAAWLLYLDFSRTINRILGLLFFLRGATIVLNQLVAIDPSRSTYWHGSRVYFFIATAFVIVDFLIVYTWRRPSYIRRNGRRFLAAFGVGVEFAYLLNHELFATLEGGNLRFGSLGLVTRMYLPLLAAAALWFSWLARNTESDVQARFHALVAMAFATAAIAETAGLLGTVILSGWTVATTGTGTSVGAVTAQLVSLSTLPIAITAISFLLGETFAKGGLRRTVWFSVLPLAALVLPILARAMAGAAESHSYLFFSAVPRAMAAFLLAYALARQVMNGPDVFQLDLRAGAAVRRGTVGGILVAMFFVVSESASQLFSEFAATQNLSPVIAQLIGILGAGILLVFLHPLNRLGERLSSSALPNAKPLRELADSERLRIYREQVELAWADGSITRKERLLLDKLREQLELPISKAVSAESRAAKLAPA